MGEDKTTHSLEMRSLRTANTDGGGQKHTLARDEETKGSEDSKHRWGRTKVHRSEEHTSELQSPA